MSALLSSWLPHLKPHQWYVLAILAVVLLVATADYVFAKRLRLMAEVINWRSATHGKETRYYVMLALCGDGDRHNRLETLEIEVSRGDYAKARASIERFSVNCSISFLFRALNVKSNVLHPWPPPA